MSSTSVYAPRAARNSRSFFNGGKSLNEGNWWGIFGLVVVVVEGRAKPVRIPTVPAATILSIHD
jgi:hypothetical protein